MELSEPVYFVHISDTHFGPTKDYGRHGHLSYPCAVQLVQQINHLPVKPDFVIHTGDVTTDPTIEAYTLAADVLGQLEMPIYYTTGNHDSARLMQAMLRMGPKSMLSDDPDLLHYQFDIKGGRFMVLDGRAPDELDPHGYLSTAQLESVRRETAQDGPPLTIFIHYPTLRMNAIWMDAYMLLINGEDLHNALLPARNRLTGVFYGHIHQSMQTIKDGILYVAVPSAFSQFTAWPTDVAVGMDPNYLPGFNFVHLLPHQTIIHQHTFPRP
jgi:Icc protein